MNTVQRRKPRKDPFVLMVSFAVGEEHFGVDILSVQEINRVPTLTRLVNVPEYVDGVITVRGTSVPVVNLRRRFGLPRKPWDNNSRILVVQASQRQIGFIVERLHEIVRIPVRLMKRLPSFPGEIKADYISAVARLNGHSLHMLDIEKIYRQEMALFDRVS